MPELSGVWVSEGLNLHWKHGLYDKDIHKKFKKMVCKWASTPQHYSPDHLIWANNMVFSHNQWCANQPSGMIILDQWENGLGSGS